MNQYTNAFFCSMRNDGGEVIIKFIQNGPCFDSEGAVSATTQEDVASLVMDRRTAQQLITALNNVVNPSSPPSEE